MIISGIYSGIGSILIPAKDLGWKVTSCFEDRREFKFFNPLSKYFDTTLYNNFADFNRHIKSPDVIISQPKCGMFSTYPTLRTKQYSKHPHLDNLIFAINTYKPRFFAIENLPKMFSFMKIDEWYKKLGHSYDLFPEYITNCAYGNVQLRRRLWLIGALKNLKYTFVPNEKEPWVTVKDTIEDLLSEESYSQFTNHHPIAMNGQVKFMVNVTSIDGEPFTPTNDFTWAQLQKYKFDVDKGEKRKFMYTNRQGDTYTKAFIRPSHWHRYSTTLAGADCVPLHPKRFVPFTIRERLRFQGMPDDYKFEGIILNEKGEMDPRKNIKYYLMTSRCIPVQFIKHLLHGFLYDQELKSTKRLYENYIINLMKYLGCKKDYLRRDKKNCLCCTMSNNCGRSMI